MKGHATIRVKRNRFAYCALRDYDMRSKEIVRGVMLDVDRACR